MEPVNKTRLRAELLRIGEQTREFDYIPSRYLQDVANSDPAELIFQVRPERPHRRLQPPMARAAPRPRGRGCGLEAPESLPPKVGKAAADRLAACGFDVRTQKHVR
jgi:hypothetical protein